MKRLMLIGQTECGKTTLLQALRGAPLCYQKTQALECDAVSIDTPGEYLENRRLNSALIITSYEADVIGLVHSAATSQAIFAPLFASVFTKPVVGIVTKADANGADIARANAHLTAAGATRLFVTSAFSGLGIEALLEYLDA